MTPLAVLPFLATAVVAHVETHALLLPTSILATGLERENLMTQSSNLVKESLVRLRVSPVAGLRRLPVTIAIATTTSAATPLSERQDRAGGCLVRGFPSLVLQDNLVGLLPSPRGPQCDVCRVPQTAILADLLLQSRTHLPEVTQVKFPRKFTQPDRLQVRDGCLEERFELVCSELPLHEHRMLIVDAKLLFLDSFRKHQVFRLDHFVNCLGIVQYLARTPLASVDVLVRLQP